MKYYIKFLEIKTVTPTADYREIEYKYCISESLYGSIKLEGKEDEVNCLKVRMSGPTFAVLVSNNLEESWDKVLFNRAKKHISENIKKRKILKVEKIKLEDDKLYNIKNSSFFEPISKIPFEVE